MTEVLYHEWNDLIFGWDGTEDRYPWVSADGVENLRYRGGLIGDGSIDGAVAAPLRAEASSWLTIVEVTADNATDWITQRDDLKAATIGGTAELPYDIYINEEPAVTRFARCAQRSIPTDEMALVRRHAVAQLMFESSDPMTYTAEQTEELDIDDTYAWAADGWAPSWRWQAVIAGPVVKPIISGDGGLAAVARYDATVDSGDFLVIKRTPRSLVTKIIDDINLLSTVDEWGVGANVYGSFDGGPTGSNRPPQWWPITAGSNSFSYDATSGSGTCDFTWREAKP